MGRGEKGREFHGGTRWVSRVPSLTSSAPPHFDVYFCFFSCLSVFSVETRSTEDKLRASLEFSRRTLDGRGNYPAWYAIESY
ncbi:hypothetical protein CGCSCA5_v011874 [Colletotrichum siamense]|nr:hypothetical protein CGCSCA5_v011874 [Colletotrichum siamense]